jgi:hypothetical protein
LITKMMHLGPIGARRGISSPKPWPSKGGIGSEQNRHV